MYLLLAICSRYLPVGIQSAYIAPIRVMSHRAELLAEWFVRGRRPRTNKRGLQRGSMTSHEVRSDILWRSEFLQADI